MGRKTRMPATATDIGTSAVSEDRLSVSGSPPFRFKAGVNKVVSEVGSAAAVALSKPALTAATPAWTCVWWQRWAAAEALGFSQEFPRRRFAACPPRSPSGLDRRQTARPFAVPRDAASSAAPAPEERRRPFSAQLSQEQSKPKPFVASRDSAASAASA